MLGTVVHVALIGLFYYLLEWGFAGVCWASALMFLFRCLANVLQVELGSKIEKQNDVHLFSWETV